MSGLAESTHFGGMIFYPLCMTWFLVSGHKVAPPEIKYVIGINWAAF
jgi:hypothetical protein